MAATFGHTPIPYPKAPSEGDGVLYGSDFGGCATYGDILFEKNSWLEPPMQTDMGLTNDLYQLVSGFKLKPYSEAGFFDVCPYSAGGTSYPTNLSFIGNTLHPAGPLSGSPQLP